MVRIAAASTDGKLINQHFGRADKFYILEADEETLDYRLVGIRKTVPVCHRGEHEDIEMEEAVKNISDCHVVLVSKIGMRAQSELERFGIEAFEIPGVIGEAVEKLIRYRKVQNLFL